MTLLVVYISGYVWTLVFSTSQHGFSLNSMYRKMQRLESPILLVIQDTDNNVSRTTRKAKLMCGKSDRWVNVVFPSFLESMFSQSSDLTTVSLLLTRNLTLKICFQVFGALTSCALKVSDHFYGTGESLLFRFQPQFQVYNWTGDNMYFIKGNNESLAIGAGEYVFMKPCSNVTYRWLLLHH